MLFLAWLTCGLAIAQNTVQDKTVIIKSVKKGEEPQQVMSALKQDFPDAIMKDIAYLPLALYGQEWTVNETDNTDMNTDIEYYQITMHGKGIKYTAVYNKNGKLLTYKETINQTRLPEAVTKALGMSFPDWKVVGDQERLKYSKDQSIVYKVELAKGKSREKVFLDDYGKILRETKGHRL